MLAKSLLVDAHLGQYYYAMQRLILLFSVVYNGHDYNTTTTTTSNAIAYAYTHTLSLTLTLTLTPLISYSAVLDCPPLSEEAEVLSLNKQ